MRKKLFVLVVGLCSLLFLAKTTIAVESTNPAETKDVEKLFKARNGVEIKYKWYISYQSGESKGKSYNGFAMKRGYLTVEKEFSPWFSARITPDIKQADETAGRKLDGSIITRIKYLYGQFNLPDFAFLTKPFIEIGVVHMPWLDFEEHINYYRCQDTMFLERNHIFNSADIGITFTSLFGGEIDEEYQKKVNRAYPGRYGSMSLGIYNGGGYHAREKNENKALEGRLTVRPLPDIIPGLQLSYFGITGKGNVEAARDWKVNLGFVSYEHEYVALTGQYYKGKGNQEGADEKDKDGYSFFAEVKPNKKFSIIGRYDFFDPDNDKKDDENTRYIVGVAYHIDKRHKNMMVIDYDMVDYKEHGKPDDKRVQVTLQIVF